MRYPTRHPPTRRALRSPPARSSKQTRRLGAGTARAALPRNVNVVAVRIVDGFFRADGAEGSAPRTLPSDPAPCRFLFLFHPDSLQPTSHQAHRPPFPRRRGASVTLIAGPVGAFDSASVPISSGEDADPGVSNAAAEAAAALRARHQGPLRGIIAGGPTGWEEAALNGIAKEVVCSLYSIRSVKGPPGAWLVPVDSHKGAGLGLLAMGVTAISAPPSPPKRLAQTPNPPWSLCISRRALVMGEATSHSPNIALASKLNTAPPPLPPASPQASPSTPAR